jgi:hypothetical protein
MLRTPALPLLLAALLALAGCSTFESRVKQKPDLYATLDTTTRTRLQAGQIGIGDTEDMVYLARSQPDEKHLTTTAAGQTTTWVYNRYWQEYRGDTRAGFQPRTRRDPVTGATSTYLEPVIRPVYADRVQAIMRITFDAGKVVAIEQPKP